MAALKNYSKWVDSVLGVAKFPFSLSQFCSVTTGEQVAAAAAAAVQAELDAEVPQTPAIQYQPTVKHTDRNKK